jgi:hypothetical protein
MSVHLEPRYDHHWLVYQASLDAPMRPGAASKTVTEYLESVGFEIVQSSPSLVFKRGNWLSSLYNPNPRSQQTHLTVDVVSGSGGSVVELTMRVNRMGNVPLGRDYEFWQAEIDGMLQALQHGYADPRMSEYAADRARLYSLVVMQWIIIAALVFFAIAMLVFVAMQ